MPKKPKISEADLAVFRKAVAGTKVLVQNKVRLTPKTRAVRQIKPPSLEAHFYFSEGHELAPVRGEEFIAYKQSSISNKTLRKLRKGQYNVEAVLDLHGLSVEEAKIAVDSFLQQCLHEGIRIVLIIHGKGQSETPILKNKLNHWLREINKVLAFCSALPSHGSRGAVYVLLKGKTEETFV